MSVDIVAEWRATLEARTLREEYGLSYSAIAATMRYFRGVDKTDEQWRGKLRRMGCEPVPHGRTLAAVRRKEQARA